jgi:hypothetical protein
VKRLVLVRSFQPLLVEQNRCLFRSPYVFGSLGHDVMQYFNPWFGFLPSAQAFRA